MQHIPQYSLEEIEQSREQMRKFKKELSQEEIEQMEREYASQGSIPFEEKLARGIPLSYPY